MGVQARQLPPPADVGGLVQHHQARDAQTTCGLPLGVLHSRLGQGHRQSGNHGGRRDRPLLAEQVEGVGAGHKVLRTQLRNPAVRRHPRHDPLVGRELHDLLRTSEDTGPGHLDHVERGLELVGLLVFSGLAQKRHGLVVTRVIDPLLHRRQGPPRPGRGQQETSYQVTRPRVEERVGLPAGRRPAGVHERLRHHSGVLAIGDVTQQVPPEGLRLADDLLRVEHPHLPATTTHLARELDAVRLVGRGEYEARSRQDPRYHPAGRLPRPGARDSDRDCFEVGVQGPVVSHRSTHRQAEAVGAHLQTACRSLHLVAAQRFRVAPVADQRRRLIAPASAGARTPECQPRRRRHQEQEGGHEADAYPHATSRR